jgi:hypothetical protein
VRRRLIAAAVGSLLLISLPASATGDDIELDDDSHVQQVIPPTMLEEGAFQVVGEPLDVNSIVITDRTPADHFVSATTPLVVALMLGSVGLVIYTLVRVEKQD